MIASWNRRPILLVATIAVLASLGCESNAGEGRGNGASPAVKPVPSDAIATQPAPATPAAAPVAAPAAAPPVAAPTAASGASGKPILYLKDGTEVALREQPIIALGRVLFRTPDGVQHAYPGDLVDLDKTRPTPAPASALTTPPATRATSAPSASTRKVPDFAGLRPDGTSVKLSELKGKVVLVDFWATWCMPCMIEMPSVKSAYGKFDRKDFEIMGVSLDSDRTRLDAYLKQQGITWPQYYDGKGWGNSVSRAWGVGSIPHAVLLDREGNIARAGLRGAQLETEIGALIKR